MQEWAVVDEVYAVWLAEEVESPPVLELGSKDADKPQIEFLNVADAIPFVGGHPVGTITDDQINAPVIYLWEHVKSIGEVDAVEF